MSTGGSEQGAGSPCMIVNPLRPFSSGSLAWNIFISACPDDQWYWKPEFSKCYYISGYKTWTDANEFCIALHPEARITSIRSQEENDYIQALIQSFENDFPWLGGSDEAEEGVWRWVNPSVWIRPQFMTQYLIRWVEDSSLIGENGSFTNWDEGEPDGDIEFYDCMHMNTNPNSGKWFDSACNDLWWTICSKPDTEKPTTEEPTTEEPAITTTRESSISTSIAKSSNSFQALIMTSCLVLVSGFARSKY